MEITLDEPEAKLAEAVVEPEPVAVVSSDFDGYSNTVSDFKDLPKVKNAKSSTYYIQIATVNKKENVAKMIDLHGKKYPVYVIKNPAKSSYQILVGPLNDDEYALVLAQKFAKGKQMDQKNLQKLYRHLASKGFDFDVCRYCANCIVEGIDDEY